MRSDARRNYDNLLAAAREVVAEQGATASLRDVARRSGVGLATLYRHFPTRESLLDALLRANFDELTNEGRRLEGADPPDSSLLCWLLEAVAVARNYSGVVATMVAAMEDPDSALHGSCVTMREAGTRLLVRAQASGHARDDIDGADLFALVSALAWLGDQPSLAGQADHLFDIITGAIMTK